MCGSMRELAMRVPTCLKTMHFPYYFSCNRSKNLATNNMIMQLFHAFHILADVMKTMVPRYLAVQLELVVLATSF